MQRQTKMPARGLNRTEGRGTRAEYLEKRRNTFFETDIKSQTQQLPL